MNKIRADKTWNTPFAYLPIAFGIIANTVLRSVEKKRRRRRQCNIAQQTINIQQQNNIKNLTNKRCAWKWSGPGTNACNFFIFFSLLAFFIFEMQRMNGSGTRISFNVSGLCSLRFYCSPKCNLFSAIASYRRDLGPMLIINDTLWTVRFGFLFKFH